ncbi:NADH-quinone oxidoreductase subunit J [Erythrobacter sp. LQ02-29]|uniref:NADH-quinone oxidoreductase subunit J n=1 Tax=unclassified Erythrobacter TaxID=2633097 RepID=UPI001BFC2539|nr:MULTISPECIES: NADH-quinone oxidoreductase subunit J [unclassified Erythrobacter]MCP9223327.1 NADH-quinone oxidoreductase subunit J [Erythrobacter sp. LQ02-29]QWC58072.1 NADH-quinone oxidoreductase subunit J [Erythrobacter sp. 3-20A1M]
MIHVLAFYLFAVLVVASGVLTIMSRNPVHSVLWLILAFFNAAGLMILLGAEFIAMLLVIVYVGAVAVLFLFVVMMLDIDFAELRAGFVKNFPIGIAIALVLLAELVLGIGAYRAGSLELGTPDGTAAPIAGASNIQSMGALLYGKYLFLFESAGIILLVAMIGAIVLTHRERARHGRRETHQNIGRQVSRRPQDATEMKNPEVGKGVEL